LKLKFLLVFVFIFSLLLVSVSADKIIQATQTLEDVGIDIRIPQTESFKVNQNRTMYIHVFNSTSGMYLTNSSTSCLFHFYNSSGNHLIEDNLGFDTDDNEFKYVINSSVISKTGFYTYIIQCNSTETGGFVSGSVMVTQDGYLQNNNGPGSIAVIIFILAITAGLFVLPFITTFSKDEILNLILKRCCWLLGIYLMMLNSSIVSTIVYSAGLNLTNEMFRYMWLFGTAGYVFMGFTLLKTLYDVMKLWQINIKEKKEKY